MKRQHNTAPTISPDDLLAERQANAQEMLEKLGRDCEQLDRSHEIHAQHFEYEVDQVRSSWTNLARSRSNEEEKRQLLSDTKAKIQHIREETRRIESESDGLVKRLDNLKECELGWERVKKLQKAFDQRLQNIMAGGTKKANEDKENDEMDIA